MSATTSMNNADMIMTDRELIDAINSADYEKLIRVLRIRLFDYPTSPLTKGFNVKLTWEGNLMCIEGSTADETMKAEGVHAPYKKFIFPIEYSLCTFDWRMLIIFIVHGAKPLHGFGLPETSEHFYDILDDAADNSMESNSEMFIQNFDALSSSIFLAQLMNQDWVSIDMAILVSKKMKDIEYMASCRWNTEKLKDELLKIHQKLQDLANDLPDDNLAMIDDRKVVGCSLMIPELIRDFFRVLVCDMVTNPPSAKWDVVMMSQSKITRPGPVFPRPIPQPKPLIVIHGFIKHCFSKLLVMCIKFVCRSVIVSTIIIGFHLMALIGYLIAQIGYFILPDDISDEYYSFLIMLLSTVTLYTQAIRQT